MREKTTMSVISRQAENISSKILAGKLPDDMIFKTIKEYGYMCHTEGYQERINNSRMFKTVRKRHRDKQFKRILDRLDDLINENQRK